ncbi:unnamed protein product [Ilex paraguariensis]|uniref:Uncharacterized protein n=1 Tax=Ilex paraguariensis TaxID=185542 RepID=A0ABC8RM52_9AQUA
MDMDKSFNCYGFFFSEQRRTIGEIYENSKNIKKTTARTYSYKKLFFTVFTGTYEKRGVEWCLMDQLVLWHLNIQVPSPTVIKDTRVVKSLRNCAIAKARNAVSRGRFDGRSEAGEDDNVVIRLLDDASPTVITSSINRVELESSNSLRD